jgi:hypothetical protein
MDISSLVPIFQISNEADDAAFALALNTEMGAFTT